MNAKTEQPTVTAVNAALWTVFEEYRDSDVAIKGIQAKADEKRANRSKHLLTAAQSIGTLEGFQAAVDAIAVKYKADAKVTRMPTTWTQAVSRVARAMKAGIDLSEFETESSLRKPVQIAEHYGEAGKELPKLPSGAIDWKGAEKVYQDSKDGKVTEGHSLHQIDADADTQKAVTGLLTTLGEVYKVKGKDAVIAACGTYEKALRNVLKEVLPSKPENKPAMLAQVSNV